MNEFNQRMVIANILVLFFVCIYAMPNKDSSMAFATEQPGVIQVKEIKLVDENGFLRGGMKIEKTNELAAVYFTDRAMKIKTYFGVSNGNAMMSMRDEKSKPRIGIFIGKDQEPCVAMKYNNGELAMGMSTTSKMQSNISFFDKVGKPKMILGITNNQGRLGMFDEDKRLRVMFGMNPGNSSVLAFLDEKSYPALAMGHLLGTPIFRLQRSEKTGIFASYAPDNNVILSMQKEGRFTWSVPEIPRGGRAGDDPLNGIDWDNMIKGWSK